MTKQTKHQRTLGFELFFVDGPYQRSGRPTLTVKD